MTDRVKTGRGTTVPARTAARDVTIARAVTGPGTTDRATIGRARTELRALMTAVHAATSARPDVMTASAPRAAVDPRTRRHPRPPRETRRAGHAPPSAPTPTPPTHRR